MSIQVPASHPPVSQQASSTSSVHVEGHEWSRCLPTDSRGPCPALNALANHGYLPRDGTNIHALNLYDALKSNYGLSTFFSGLLAFGAVLVWGRGFALHDLGDHKKMEHDASLVHANVAAGERYAPGVVDGELLEQLIGDCQTVVRGPDGDGKERLLDIAGVAHARARRERESPPLDGIHAEFARGEAALLMGVIGTQTGDTFGVPVGWIREFMGEERIPTGWKPTRVMGLFDIGKIAKAIQAAMKNSE